MERIPSTEKSQWPNKQCVGCDVFTQSGMSRRRSFPLRSMFMRRINLRLEMLPTGGDSLDGD